MHNFLIVKLSSLGDILQTFPVIEYLKFKYPGCSIDWVVEEKGRDLVERHPLIDHVYTIDRSSLFKSLFQSDLRKKTYDQVFDFQGNCKSALFTLVAKSRLKTGFGRQMVAEWPNLLVTNDKVNPTPGRNRRDDYLQIAGSPSFVPKGILLKLSEDEEQLIAPYMGKKALVAHGSMWESKKLPKEKWVDLLKNIDGPILFAWGSSLEKEEAIWMQSQLPNSQLLPKLSLHCLQHVMDSVDIVLSVDSLALHLAGTTKTSTISFFGPSSSIKYAPTGPHHVSVSGTCPYNITFDRRCPKLRTCKDSPCIKNIPHETLINLLNRF